MRVKRGRALYTSELPRPAKTHPQLEVLTRRTSNSLETKSSTDKLLFGIKTLTKIYGGVVMFERWADVRALFEVRELIG